MWSFLPNIGIGIMSFPVKWHQLLFLSLSLKIFHALGHLPLDVFLELTFQSCTQNLRWGCTSTKRDNHFSCPAGNAVLKGPRSTVTFLAGRALLVHIQLAISLNSLLFFHEAAFQALVSQLVHIAWITPSQVENPPLAVIQFHVADDCPPL